MKQTMTRGAKQAALVAAIKLMGLAKFEEAGEDYFRFRANNLAAVEPALKIAEEVTAQFGWEIAVVF